MHPGRPAKQPQETHRTALSSARRVRTSYRLLLILSDDIATRGGTVLANTGRLSGMRVANDEVRDSDPECIRAETELGSNSGRHRVPAGGGRRTRSSPPGSWGVIAHAPIHDVFQYSSVSQYNLRAETGLSAVRGHQRALAGVGREQGVLCRRYPLFVVCVTPYIQ